MRYGFTLIELLIALAIASTILAILFNSFFQSSRIVDRAEDIMSINSRAALVQYQLEKDLMGAFIPVQALKDENKKDDTGKKPEPKKEKKELKELKKVFYGINKGEKLDVLTFITNNPMSAYWSQQLGKAKPKIARVVYRFVEDKERKGWFTLLRQEDYNLDFEAYALGGPKEVRAYELAEGIKDFSVTYTVMFEEEKKDEKKKKEVKFKTLSEWNMEKDAQIPKDIKRRIPNAVGIKVTFWDMKGIRDASFTFSILILPDVSFNPKVVAKDIDKKTDTAKKSPSTPGSESSSAQPGTTPQPSAPARTTVRVPQHKQSTPGGTSKPLLLSMRMPKGAQQ